MRQPLRNRRTSALGTICSRRDWLRWGTAGVVSTFGSLSGWLPVLAAAGTNTRTGKPPRSVILLWMAGGPSQIDTFDPKPGHANGGTFKPIATAVPGIQIGEHLPLLAQRLSNLAIIRSMTSKEGDHERATGFVHTGYPVQTPIRYPVVGSFLSKAQVAATAASTTLVERTGLPAFVSIAANSLFPAASPGYLGSTWAPLFVNPITATGGANNETSNSGNIQFEVPDLNLPVEVDAQRSQRRLQLRTTLEETFRADRPAPILDGQRIAYERATQLMRGAASEAFQLEREPAELRQRYGLNVFGQGCLLARRLVERGVHFIEVTLNGADANNGLGWDTHTDNFTNVRQLCQILDPAWATLLDDLQSRGLLEETLIVWMGEFGRTPKINPSAGRDHFPDAWSAVLAGGGIRGGQVIGRTSDDGLTVTDRPVQVPDLLATVCQAVGIKPDLQNESNVGRPIPLVDSNANVIHELLS